MQWHNVLGHFNVNYIRKMCDLPHTNLLYMVYTQVYEPYMIDGGGLPPWLRTTHVYIDRSEISLIIRFG